MWLLLIKDLKAFIASQPAERDTTLTVGTKGHKPSTFPAIYFIRGKDLNVDFHQQKKGTNIMVVEIWVNSVITADPLEAYEQLVEVETRFLDYLAKWQKLLNSRLGIGATLAVTAFRGDGEAHRPQCASQAFIQINWQK